MTQVVCHRRHEGDERRSEQAHHRDQADGGATTGLGTGGPEPQPEGRDEAQALVSARRRRKPYEGEGDHDGQERHGVGDERDRVAEGGDGRAGERRTDHPSEVELGGVQRDRGEEFGPRYEIGKDRLLEGTDESTHATLGGDQERQDARPVTAGTDEQGDDERDRAGGEVPRDERRPPGNPVGERCRRPVTGARWEGNLRRR